MVSEWSPPKIAMLVLLVMALVTIAIVIGNWGYLLLGVICYLLGVNHVKLG